MSAATVVTVAAAGAALVAGAILPAAPAAAAEGRPAMSRPAEGRPAMSRPAEDGAAKERAAAMPSGAYHVPAYRPAPAATRLVVCKPDSRRRIEDLPVAAAGARALSLRLLPECAYRDIQAAVDAVRVRGTTIYVLPGRYRERPARAAPADGRCEKLAGRGVLSYAEQRACPHAQNLIAIFGDEHPADPYDVCDGPRCDLQIEGTGGRPGDVVVEGGYRRDGSWTKRYGIRADRADGFYLRNLETRLFGDVGVHIMQTDGFVVDRVRSRWNQRYGLRMFAADHGLVTDCEASGNGAAGIAAHATAGHGGRRPSVEVRRCGSHHNLLGYSGAASDSVYVHDSEFAGNSTGVAVHSPRRDMPGLPPQDHAMFVANWIHGNNADHFRRVRDGTCRRPPRERGHERGAVCPAAPVPVGTGLLLAGGNDNTYTGNLVYDNWRYGFMQFWVPAPGRAERDPTGYRDTAHGNRYVGNLLGYSPTGAAAPNGTDVWWDEQGDRNCWGDNLSAWGAVRSDPAVLPGCPGRAGAGPNARYGSGPKTARLAACGQAERVLRGGGRCDWLTRPRRPKPATVWTGPGRV